MRSRSSAIRCYVTAAVGVTLTLWRARLQCTVLPSVVALRRHCVLGLGSSAGLSIASSCTQAQAAQPSEQAAHNKVSIPLHFERGAYYLNFTAQGQQFRSVLDTGSPFVLVATCTGQRKAAGKCENFCRRYGCAEKTIGEPTGLADNFIVTSGARSTASWRRGEIVIGGTLIGSIAFGVVSETDSFGGNAGGTNFGIIRTAADDPAIRPTFLGQTKYRYFIVDLKPGQEFLEFYIKLPSQPRTLMMPLVDLRGYGAPVVYYAVDMRELWFDGVECLEGASAVAILDTGTTGLSLPPVLFDKYTLMRRFASTSVNQTKRSRFRTGNVEVSLGSATGSLGRFTMLRGPVESLGGARIDVVTPIPYDAGDTFYRAEQINPDAPRPFVIFLGLAFLLGRRLCIDTESLMVGFD